MLYDFAMRYLVCEVAKHFVRTGRCFEPFGLDEVEDEEGKGIYIGIRDLLLMNPDWSILGHQGEVVNVQDD